MLNAFFAATEIAVVSLSENKLRKQARDGDRRAEKMLKMVTEPTGFLSTIQIGITLAGYLGAAFAADSFSGHLVNWFVNIVGITFVSPEVLNTVSIVLVTLILAYFNLVLGELVPKRIAMKKPEQLARAVCGIILGLRVALKPVVWFLTASTNSILRIIKINPNSEDEPVSEEDIRMLIDIGEETGSIDPVEREMIDNIFEFNDLTAGDIMVHRTDMEAIKSDSDIEDISNLITQTGFSRFPVYAGDIDEIIGILRTREFLLNLHSDNPKPLEEILGQAHLVPETVRADALLRDMQAKDIHMAIVVDEYGGTSGLVTMEDLLEEIVGNIYDELDEKPEPEITKIGENMWRVAGGFPIEELVESTGIKLNFDDDEYGTLGGLIYSQLTQIPEDGSQPEVSVEGLKIKVEEIADHRVEWAIVTVLPPSLPEGISEEIDEIPISNDRLTVESPKSSDYK